MDQGHVFWLVLIKTGGFIPLFLGGFMYVRNLRFISRFACFLASSFFIESSFSATYEGQWTRIILDRVNASSLDITATAKLDGPDLTPRSYSVPAVLTASRLAKLGRGFLRGGVYGLLINAALENKDWIWDEVLKNWYKNIETAGSSCSGLPDWTTQHSSWNCSNFPHYYKFESSGGCYISELSIQDLGCGVPQGWTQVSSEVCGVSSCTPDHPSWKKFLHVRSVDVVPPSVDRQYATDQDVFTDGVVPNPSGAVNSIITGLPTVINNNISVLNRATNIVNINWPEIVSLLASLTNAANNAVNVEEIVNKVLQEGVESLTQEQLDALVQNNVDLTPLLDAINALSNNTTLTTEQQTAINNYNDIHDVTNNISGSQSEIVSNTIDVNIPTDCDLIPFVCDFLTWFKGWLTEEPPPIPDVLIPVEPLDDFVVGTSPSGSCPASYQISVFSHQYDISYQPFCDLAVLLNPLVVAISWILAAFVVTRSR